MKYTFCLSCFTLLLAGCSEPGSDPGAGSGTSAISEPAAATTVAFKAGESATLAVPEMECPFVCYESVKDILEEIPGVESVALVPQKEDGKIDDRRVTVSFDGEVEGSMALAALANEDFENSRFE